MRTSIVGFFLFCVGCGASQAPSQGDNGVPGGGPLPPNPTGTTPPAPAPTPTPVPPPRLGANVTKDGVVFKVWSPHATRARVTGDFGEKELAKEEGNVFSATVADARAGMHYRFVLDVPSGTLERIDPYCRELDGGSCVVVDPSAYAWKTPAFTRPSREKSVVYEMHVGSFSVAEGKTHGTFASAMAKLPRLADLGVNVIELMPIHAFGGGDNGWGYNPQLFFAPKASYGTSTELRAFVDEAHRLGMAVWIDTVLNHTDGYKKAPLACFDGCDDGSNGIYFFGPGPYATTPWGPRPNYVEPEVKEMFLASAKAWLGEYRGDGFRVDSVSNIRALDGKGTTPGGKELVVAINDATHALGGTSVAEDLKGYEAITIRSSDGGFAFDAQWDGFGYDVTNLLVPYADDTRDLGVVARLLKGGYATDGFARLLFTETHDTVGNGGARLPAKIDPADPTSLAARRRTMLAQTLLFTTPGMPMIFMGQEDFATAGFTSDPKTLDLVTPRNDAAFAFTKALIALRRNLAGMTGGLADAKVDILHQSDANKVIAYRRHGASGEDVVVVLNLRNKAYTRYDVGIATAGTWRVRLDSASTTFGDDLAGAGPATVTTIAQTKDDLPNTLPLVLPAYGALVLSR